MQKLDLVRMNPSRLTPATTAGRVFVFGRPTEYMQLRAVTRMDGERVVSEFVCGIDRITTNTGRHVWTTQRGIWGHTVPELVQRIIKYAPELVEQEVLCLFVCDDTIEEETADGEFECNPSFLSDEEAAAELKGIDELEL